MVGWWNSLTDMQHFFALVAVPATIILLLQTILLLFGMGEHHADTDHDHDFDHDHDLDHDHDHDFAHDHDHDHGHDYDFNHDHDHDHAHDHPHGHEHHDPGLRIFTVRTFIAFFSIFGWVGIVLIGHGTSNITALLIATLSGLAAMLLVAYVMRMAYKLQSSGNIDASNAVGKTGTVYLTIPPARRGKGKITLLLQGRLTEMDAVTDHDSPLKTNSEVLVISVSNQYVLTVIPKVKS